MRSIADHVAGALPCPEASSEPPHEAVACAVHAINNPLFAILGLLEFQLAETGPGTNAHERLTMARDSALEIQAIVTELGNRSRTWEGAG